MRGHRGSEPPLNSDQGREGDISQWARGAGDIPPTPLGLASTLFSLAGLVPGVHSGAGRHACLVAVNEPRPTIWVSGNRVLLPWLIVQLGVAVLPVWPGWWKPAAGRGCLASTLG